MLGFLQIFSKPKCAKHNEFAKYQTNKEIHSTTKYEESSMYENALNSKEKQKLTCKFFLVLKNLLNKKRKYKKWILLLGLAFLLVLSYIKLVPNNGTSGSKISAQPYNSKKDYPFAKGCNDIELYLSNPDYKKQNATFIMLTRNEELNEVIKTLENIEIRFNQWFHYPYVFLNDIPFEDTFKEEVLKTVSVPNDMVKFSVLNVEKEWTFDGENEKESRIKIDVSLKDQEDRGLLYGGIKSYHKMCRFYSGFFQDHEALKAFDYYWRIEPDVKFFCDLTYDPFYEMNKAGKKYGFTVLISELYWTIPSLFRYTKAFINNTIKSRPGFKVGSLWDVFIKDFKVFDVAATQNDIADFQLLDKFINNEYEINKEVSRYVQMKEFLTKKKDFYKGDKLKEEYNRGAINTIKFAKKIPQIYDDKFANEEYNLCHFWSNFEIASFEIFRSPIYREYFQFLDKKMGFVKERFGDAPIHTLGVAMLLNLEDVHYFRDIAYSHSSLTHCIGNDQASGDFKNKVDPLFLEEKWKNFKYYKYSKQAYFKQQMISKFRKLLVNKETAKNDINIGCNCDCPIWHNEIEDAAIECSSKLFQLMSDNHTPKSMPSFEYVMKGITDKYKSYLQSLIS